MVKFDYLPDDRIARVTDVFSSFNEPSNPIPNEITELTGITDEWYRDIKLIRPL
jgi:DNA polymerase-3 subunit epsilon